MRLSGWMNVALTVLAITGCVFGVSKEREQQMAPHPGTASLKRTVAEIVSEFVGSRSVPVEVIERNPSVYVRSHVSLPAGPMNLAPVVVALEAQGYKRHAFSQNRYAIVCKGETVIKVNLSSPDESGSRSARIEASWGTAPIFGGTRPTCPAGSR
jgi:hypothetical protein